VEFWAASESDAASYAAVESVRLAIEPVLADLLRQSQLSAATLLFRYVPIVMPPELLDRYPPRSEARLKERIVDCAPQLDHETFVQGGFGDQVQTYVDGIRTDSALLQQFGLYESDVREFQTLLTRAADHLTS
jgi:hypothetical protein